MIGDRLTSLELCAGAGGQALGIEKAKFKHGGLVEIDHSCYETLRLPWEPAISFAFIILRCPSSCNVGRI